ncbi:MAG: transcriptional repressor, partial [Kiloniellales bacterium]|nr:transcriptional repressor [Kiloniellales bacterium]
FDGERHDHDLCIERALSKAERLCQRRGARLTTLRKRVLALVWTSHSPVGAYDVLARLSEDHGRTAPPTVYRALEFLLEQGLVHRIESLNAFVGCPDPGVTHSGQFLICRDCGAAAEMDVRAIDKAISAQAAACGFAVEGKTVEVRGLCPACQPAAARR